MLIKNDQDIIKGYLEDSSNLSGGYADSLYIPENEKDIIEVLKECNSKKNDLTISAGQTGTTGGCIPFGGKILTTQKLNKIIEVNAKEKYALVEPGVTLEELDKAAAKENLLYAPDPTEKKAFIGGNVSTNASGGRCYRFGSTRNHVLGLRIILPSGEILDIERGRSFSNSKLATPNYQSPLIKSSAGYFSRPNMDLIDLFIGNEGTLGIISRIKLKLIDSMKETFDLVAFFRDENDAVDFVEKAKQTSNKNINFFEFFDNNTLKMLKSSFPHIPEYARAAIYIEQELLDKNYLDQWLKLLSIYSVSPDDCWLGMDKQQKQELADFRHAIPEHINELFKKHHLIKLATDIAVPEGKFKEMFNYYHCDFFHIKFGHIGDNHLHVNLLPNDEKELEIAKDLIMSFVKKGISLGGTVSAEHGIGKIKHVYLKEMYGSYGIKEMQRIKQYFDPNLILNKGNIF